MRPLRCFVAVDFPIPRSVRVLAEEFATFGGAVRATPVENLHVTLKFLGDVEANDVRAVDAVVRDVARGIAPFDFHLQGLGAFPSTRRPSVVWVGVAEAEALVAVAETLEREFTPLGFPPEPRAYTPHLTVARVRFRAPSELRTALEVYAEELFGTVHARRIALFQSVPRSGGPEYTPIATHELVE